MTSDSRVTSLVGMFDDASDATTLIKRVEIPLFQRDYAQGRGDATVSDIRSNFLDVLLTAVDGYEPQPVGLDFVYGEVESGTLRPLDGQQRLTTLFLLHWYLASRAGHLAEHHGWKRFSYATRPSARLFCERLVASPLPDLDSPPSSWIVDQSWYLFVWRHDPTIQSMLVMIDAIDKRFKDVDAKAAWARLADTDDPAISFLLLSLPDMGSAEDLYIKMNSRGKPLTEFENFKAHFEKTIETSDRAGEFALKVDTNWSDLLWRLRGDDDLVDDEFLRYIEYVTEICEWRDGRTDGARDRLEPRSRMVFGDGNSRHDEHLEFLFRAFDVWADRSIEGTFNDLFTDGSGDTARASKVRLFFRNDGTRQERLNMFDACCRSFGESRGRARVFSLGQSLVLYAVLIHLVENTDHFPLRIRVLRNLIEASSDELRPERMPKILEDVHSVIRHGTIDAVTTLNQAQVEDEKLKAAFLEANPGLQAAVFGLEDHELLRGSLGAFELDAAAFESRATVFHRLLSEPELWPALTGALLAIGEYQRRRTNSRPFLFGTDSKKHDNAWRELLTGANRERLQGTRQVLAKFLDLVEAEAGALGDTLKEITRSYLAQRESEQRFDWRYYLVKYPCMREQGSSTYFAERFDGAEQAEMGYSLCMLRGGARALNGRYRDPYLLAIWRELEDSNSVDDPWFTGYEENPRWLTLNRSGAALRCVPTGFELSPPQLEDHVMAFEALCRDLGVGADNLVTMPQVNVDGRGVDTVDRVQVGADIVRRMVAAGI